MTLRGLIPEIPTYLAGALELKKEEEIKKYNRS